MSPHIKFFKNLCDGIKSFISLLPTLRHVCRNLKQMCKAFCRWMSDRKPRQRGGCCVDIPISEYKRPDPLLYAQFYLMKQGLAVTWDNPDIQLYDAGVAVSSSSLKANHDYEVVVRVWNNSYDAPAANLPVYLSFLDFGAGTTSNAVGKTFINLGVKASAHCPAFAKFTWHTPQAEGHYCLQALLDWPDDANPDNNLGQENTNVGKLHSPATFTFPVQNNSGVTRRYLLEPDMYRLPELDPCPPEQPPSIRGGRTMTRLQESRMRWAKALATQGYGHFPVDPEWSVTIEPRGFSLNPHEEVKVTVNIEYLLGAFVGQQAFNINAFANGPHTDRELVGGVTLTVEG
jgi:hypothetical protein